MTKPTPAQASVEAVIAAIEDQMPATQDWTSTLICEALERAIAAVLALSPPPTVGAEDEAVAHARAVLAQPGIMMFQRSTVEDLVAIIDRLYDTRPAPAADGQEEADLFARSLAWLADEPLGPAEGLVSEPEEREEHRAWEEKMPPDFVDAVAKARIRACLATDREGA